MLRRTPLSRARLPRVFHVRDHPIGDTPPRATAVGPSSHRKGSPPSFVDSPTNSSNSAERTPHPVIPLHRWDPIAPPPPSPAKGNNPSARERQVHPNSRPTRWNSTSVPSDKRKEGACQKPVFGGAGDKSGGQGHTCASLSYDCMYSCPSESCMLVSTPPKALCTVQAARQ